MKKALVPIITLLVILFIAGGFTAIFQGIEVLGQVFIGFWPFFSKVIVQSFKDYLTSAYFIVGVIIFVGSSIGIVFSVKERKVLYFIISLVLDIVSLASIISNLVVCN